MIDQESKLTRRELLKAVAGAAALLACAACGLGNKTETPPPFNEELLELVKKYYPELIKEPLYEHYQFYLGKENQGGGKITFLNFSGNFTTDYQALVNTYGFFNTLGNQGLQFTYPLVAGRPPLNVDLSVLPRSELVIFVVSGNTPYSSIIDPHMVNNASTSYNLKTKSLITIIREGDFTGDKIVSEKGQIMNKRLAVEACQALVDPRVTYLNSPLLPSKQATLIIKEITCNSVGGWLAARAAGMSYEEVREKTKTTSIIDPDNGMKYHLLSPNTPDSFEQLPTQFPLIYHW